MDRAWLLDVYRQFPNFRCDGFDITKAHFPAQHWLPDTVNFHVWDAFSEVPEEYVGAFDVVHTRTIYSAIANNNVEPLLSNMLKMLKPGGYLQWDELDASTLEAHVPPNVSGEKTEMIVRVMDLLSAAQNNLRPEWLHNLGTTMQDKGCTVVADDRLEPRKELVKAWSDNMLFIWGILNPSFSDEDMRLPPGKGVPETISRSSFAKLVAECAEEMQNGVGADMKSIVVVGQKAS